MTAGRPSSACPLKRYSRRHGRGVSRNRASNGEAAKVIFYRPDGTGRDRYIVDNSGGLTCVLSQKGMRAAHQVYWKSLRQHQKRDVVRYNAKPDYFKATQLLQQTTQ